MAEIHASAEHVIAAPPEQVYTYIADFNHHQKFLPPAFFDFKIEQGGVGEGTVTSFKIKAGPTVQPHRTRVIATELGRSVTETDEITGGTTVFSIQPEGTGSRVRIDVSYRKGGIAGAFERLVAPPVMRKLFLQELHMLDSYAQYQASVQV